MNKKAYCWKDNREYAKEEYGEDSDEHIITWKNPCTCMRKDGHKGDHFFVPDGEIGVHFVNGKEEKIMGQQPWLQDIRDLAIEVEALKEFSLNQEAEIEGLQQEIKDLNESIDNMSLIFHKRIEKLEQYTGGCGNAKPQKQKYRHKPIIVEATQWFEHGDHAAVNPYPPKYNKKCDYCGLSMSEHGWMYASGWGEYWGEYTVCPKTWIVKNADGNYSIYDPVVFKQTYEEVT